jgi:hypothetical protein
MHPWSALNPSHAVLQFEGLTFFFLNYPFCLSSALSPFLVNPTAFCCAWLSGGGGDQHLQRRRCLPLAARLTVAMVPTAPRMNGLRPLSVPRAFC